jgi:hypothetical protein
MEKTFQTRMQIPAKNVHFVSNQTENEKPVAYINSAWDLLRSVEVSYKPTPDSKPIVLQRSERIDVLGKPYEVVTFDLPVVPKKKKRRNKKKKSVEKEVEEYKMYNDGA